jgi:hypothetical protein
MPESAVPQQLSDEEFKQFRGLLRRYCAWNLDQWDTWRTHTRYGPVYISISRKPLDGARPDSYESVDRALNKLPDYRVHTVRVGQM